MAGLLRVQLKVKALERSGNEQKAYCLASEVRVGAAVNLGAGLLNVATDYRIAYHGDLHSGLGFGVVMLVCPPCQGADFGQFGRYDVGRHVLKLAFGLAVGRYRFHVSPRDTVLADVGSYVLAAGLLHRVGLPHSGKDMVRQGRVKTPGSVGQGRSLQVQDVGRVQVAGLLVVNHGCKGVKW